MLSQITELTNKVAKLKAWKKAVKKEMYEDVEDTPQVAQPPTQPQVEPSMEQPSVEPLMESPVEPPAAQQDYMSQIPQQYLQQGYEAQYIDPLTSSELRLLTSSVTHKRVT